MSRPFRSRSGSVLPLVLIFASIAFITVAAFVSGQYIIGKPSLMAPAMLQAQLNARSGVWKALDMMKHPSDTLKAINTLDSSFTHGLFGSQPDSSSIRSNDLIADDSIPLPIQPFSCDSFGTCEVSLSYSGCFQQLRSKGTFLSKEKYVQVKIGGRIAISPDTVLYLDSGIALQTPIRGKYRIGPRDSSSGIRGTDLDKLIKHFSKELSDSGVDTMMAALPLLIQHKDEFDKIKLIVKGPLFIDGSHFSLEWKADKKITVLGDLQITGSVTIEGLTFVVVGETRILDNAQLRNVTIFSSKRISIENKALFSGTAITLANLLVSGNGTVENRSTLVIAQVNLAKSNAVAALITTPPSPHGASIPGNKPKLKPFAATFIESATIDATIITYKNPLGIKIGNGAQVKGVLWTDGAMSLDGKVYGIIYASKLVDGDLAISGQPAPAVAVIRGNILPIQNIDRYYFPFFLGQLSIISWIEQ